MNAQDLRFLQVGELADLAGKLVTAPCCCGMAAHLGWASIIESQWPAAQMQAIGTLRDFNLAEPTYEEHHPAGTRYVLRYTEYGGYYVDHRARCLSGAQVLERT